MQNGVDSNYWNNMRYNGMQDAPQSMTNQNMPENQDNMDIDDHRLQEMFPDLYPQIKPHIDELARMLQGQEMNDSMIDSIVDDILSRTGGYSGYWPEDMEEAIPTQTNYRGNYRPYPNPYYRRRRYPMYYYDLSLRDLIRLLLLRQLGGHRY